MFCFLVSCVLGKASRISEFELCYCLETVYAALSLQREMLSIWKRGAKANNFTRFVLRYASALSQASHLTALIRERIQGYLKQASRAVLFTDVEALKDQWCHTAAAADSQVLSHVWEGIWIPN